MNIYYRNFLLTGIIFTCFSANASSGAVAGRHARAGNAHDSNCVGMFTGYSYTWPLRSGHGTQAFASREVNIQNEAESDQLEYGSEEWQQEKKKLNVMLWASVIILTIFFFGLVLITFIRMGRHYRKRVTGDKKTEPTEYVDAWSQYRLKDDNDEKN
jgi:hypothetical protein